MAGFSLSPLIAFFIVLALIPLARGLALKFGYVDCPGGRKGHDCPTPPVGGLVIVPIFILVSLLSGAQAGTQWPFWLGLAVIVLAGSIDDRYSIRPRWKFVAQFTASILIVMFGEAKVTSLGDLFGFGAFGLNFASAPFSVIAAVLLINAINLLDGLDGLAGGITLIALFWLAVPCLLAGNIQVALSICILIGALAGFLFFNLRHPFRARANIFLGDAGSMSLGLALAWYGMTLGRSDTPVVQPIAVAWILALPIMDTCAQFARRVREGRHPFDADRHHFHHHFINAGMDVAPAVTVIMLIGFLLGLIGVGGMILHVPEYVLAYAWIATLLIHMAVSLRPARFHRVVSLFLGKNAS